MMRFMFRCACALLLLLPFARVDANSFYWDPAFNGEGWSIDRQNDVIFLAYYTYEANNQPTFLTAVGEPTYSLVAGPDATQDVHVAQFTGTLFRSQRGQPATAAGTLAFRHEQGNGIDRILVSFNNQSRTLVPFYYAYPTRGHALFGLWAMSFINADLGVTGMLALVEEDDLLALDNGGLVFGIDPATGRDILLVYFNDEAFIAGIIATDNANVDMEFAVLHGVKDSRPMRGLWVFTDAESGDLLSDIFPFTATKYRSLGELDDVGVFAEKGVGGHPDAAFRERALARLAHGGGARALLERLRPVR